MYSSGPETSISRMRGLFADIRAILFNTVKPRLILSRENAVQLDGSSQVLPEAGVEEVIVIPNLETGLGEEVGEILLEIVVNTLKTGSGVCAFLGH